MTEQSIVLSLDDPAAELALAGGKGASLSKLARAGLPVPGGFHVTTVAYRDFVTRNDLREPIRAAVSDETPQRAARLIAGLFAERDMPEATAEAIRKSYAVLGEEAAVAVRSSATAEDLPQMSFAGQQDSYLDIRGEAALLDAVKRCWASLWTARAIGYRARNGVAPEDVALAVVVQELVPADAAGIAFTADPVTGDREQISVNAAWGLGEAVVGGEVTPDTYVVDRASGALVEQQTAEKTVMTVRTPDGTRAEPVPADRRTRPVLDSRQATELAGIGARVEELYGQPMDIEWALHGGRFSVVQARPITGLRAPDDRQELEEWNDSLAGDYLWTSGNIGEAIPSVMTPATWSLAQILIAEAMAPNTVVPVAANIGGRFYLNLGFNIRMADKLGLRPVMEQVFGRLPEDLEIPPMPVPFWRVLPKGLPLAARRLRMILAYRKRFPELVAGARQRCETLHGRIAGTTAPAALAALWRDGLDPLLRDTSRLLAVANRIGGLGPLKLRTQLQELVGEADTNALLSGLHTEGGPLTSLGPMLGLEQLAHGEIDRETFARRWGHRCPDEFEISVPRPAEDPAWIDRQLAGLRDAEHDVDALLARQEQARTAAWQRFRRDHPRQVTAMRRRIEKAAVPFRAREDARSEVVRAFWVLRAFVLRAGELTGHGDDLFFLRIEEILDVLRGDEEPLGRVAIRRRTYEHYAALPPYPTLIRGRFDPERWAADPNRRSDVYDEHGDHTPAGDAVTGFPGAAGVVEGTARVVVSVEEGDQLRAGEVLVTTVTNVGWTPLFPRAAAVVTDVGAPLSHAAIVARELGIPAVVGCGNAMTRLRTGDRLRVDGEHGTVEVLEPADTA